MKVIFFANINFQIAVYNHHALRRASADLKPNNYQDIIFTCKLMLNINPEKFYAYCISRIQNKVWENYKQCFIINNVLSCLSLQHRHFYYCTASFYYLERKESTWKITIIPANITCSRSIMETLEKGVKYVQSYQ